MRLRLTVAAAEIAATASAAAVCASDGVSSSSATTFSGAATSSSTASTGDAAWAAAFAAMAATASLAFTADRDRSRAFEDPSTGVAGSESPSSEKPSLATSFGYHAAVLARSSGEEPVATPSSRRRVDGVKDDAMIQHERAVRF